MQSRLTIITHPQSPAPKFDGDPQALALGALGWVLAETGRAERLLALTGLTPDELRAGIGEPAVLGAVIEFLCAHEPDLLAASDHLGVPPGLLAATRERLER